MLWAGCQFCSPSSGSCGLQGLGGLQVACVGSYSGSQYPTQAHPGSPWDCPFAAGCRARQQRSFLLCFLNTDYVSQCTENIYESNGENIELWLDLSLARAHKSNFPLLSHPSFSLKARPMVSPGHLWYTQSWSGAGNAHLPKVCTVQVTTTFFGASYA